MNMSFFDQFTSPTMAGIPLTMLALIAPWFMMPAKTSKWLNNRLYTIQLWFSSLFVKQLMSPLNKKGHKWSLLLMTLLIFILLNNLLGLLPYTFTPTTQLSMNLGLAVPLWLSTIILGTQNQLTVTLSHLLPEGTPTLLIPTLVIIETISLLIRPLALGIRLTANLTAGHLLIQLISTAILTILPLMPMVSTLAFMILLLLTLLEIAVAMIQAYVFVLLLSLYLQENL
uniref:ATP synthase subunit a n=1 Tax=Rhyacotriton variegatus TaxID=291264 RepID=Q644W6_9SALA|nr:ATP synthase F0 subunit 6 [Rhyacotriton variegatus]AAU20518.1 ATP synthase F0 subunit 6 [Rhyacotriton variegatus]